jgi:hypothetical protein
VSTPDGATTPWDRRKRRRLWWLIPEVAAVVLLLVLLVPRLLDRSSQASGPPTLEAAAAERAARALEQVSPAEHHDHGHEVGDDDRIFCGVAVFGVEPASATVIEDVETVYGYYFCAVGRRGLPYLQSSRADGPIVVRLTDPPVVQVVPPGADYQERVRALMPDEYEELCFSGLPDQSVAEEVKRRYEAAFG